MPALNLAFVPNDSSAVYRVEVSGYKDPFDSPRLEYEPNDCQIVSLSQHSGGVHIMHPLPSNCYYCPQDPQHVANALGPLAKRIIQTVSNYHLSDSASARTCALTIMAWYLIDNNADTIQFTPNMRFDDDDHEIWAVVFVFRNLWILSPHLSDYAVHAYLMAFYSLISILNSYGFIIQTSKFPE